MKRRDFLLSVLFSGSLMTQYGSGASQVFEQVYSEVPFEGELKPFRHDLVADVIAEWSRLKSEGRLPKFQGVASNQIVEEGPYNFAIELGGNVKIGTYEFVMEPNSYIVQLDNSTLVGILQENGEYHIRIERKTNNPPNSSKGDWQKGAFIIAAEKDGVFHVKRTRHSVDIKFPDSDKGDYESLWFEPSENPKGVRISTNGHTIDEVLRGFEFPKKYETFANLFCSYFKEKVK